MCRGIIMLVLPRENNRYRETKNVWYVDLTKSEVVQLLILTVYKEDI